MDGFMNILPIKCIIRILYYKFTYFNINLCYLKSSHLQNTPLNLLLPHPISFFDCYLILILLIHLFYLTFILIYFNLFSYLNQNNLINNYQINFSPPVSHLPFKHHLCHPS